MASPMPVTMTPHKDRNNRSEEFISIAGVVVAVVVAEFRIGIVAVVVVIMVVADIHCASHNGTAHPAMSAKCEMTT